MNHALQLSTRTLASTPPGRCASWCFLARSSFTIGVAAFGAVVSGLTAGLVAAVTTLGALAGTLLVLVQTRLVRCAIAREMNAAWRRKRAARRDARLAGCGSIRRGDLAELTALVEEVHQTEPIEASSLEELLDRFAERAALHERLVGDEPFIEPCPPRAGLHAELRRRRAAHRNDCRRRADEVNRELDTIGELVRLVAERAACPAEIASDESGIEQRVWDMDVRDRALAEMP